MTARTASSLVTWAAAAAISVWICALSAFIFGRSSRIVAIWSATSTRTNSPTQSSSASRPVREPAASLSYRSRGRSSRKALQERRHDAGAGSAVDLGQVPGHLGKVPRHGGDVLAGELAVHIVGVPGRARARRDERVP